MTRLVFALLVALVLAGGLVLGASRTRAAEVQFTGAQSDYLEHCGGCHGLQGDTSPAPIPVLRGRAGYFLCIPASRSYLLRLPNVTRTMVDDDQAVADMMNFVAFELGGPSAPKGARPFTAAEVAAGRHHTMSGDEMIEERRRVVEALIATCGAPASLRQSYPGQPVSPRR